MRKFALVRPRNRITRSCTRAEVAVFGRRNVAERPFVRVMCVPVNDDMYEDDETINMKEHVLSVL